MDRALPCLRPWLRFAGIALLALGCGDAPRPNVLLVTIDTLRADRLSGAGHSRQTTPYLDELAASGVRFERAYASSSWTAPSVASLLTSLDPRRHGIEHGHLSEQVIVQQEVIPDSLPLWPELLRNAGYRTYGITANTHLYGRFGFDRGFDRYECIGFVTADEVLETLERWQLEITASEPWFVWVHLLDPHARYTPRSPWIDEFFPRYPKLLRSLRDVLIPAQYAERGVTPGSRRFDLVGALYDSEIAYTDQAVRSISAALRVNDRDLVIVTSDHGEEFLDHGGFGHGTTLYEEVLRVPLLLRLPGAAQAGRVVSSPVSGIDLLPTVLDLLDVATPDSLQGRSVRPLIEGSAADATPVSASLDRFAALAQDALILGRWKYLEHRSSGERKLFDLEDDPGEQRDRIEFEPEKAEELAGLLAARRADALRRRVEPGLAELTEQQLEQLKALGYVP
jgi:arylsulfatase A-like enzyme